MTQKDYFKFLVKLAELDHIETESEDYSDNLFGLFQCFMPNGKNIDQVFEPIPNGKLYADRIRQIYTITESEVTKKFEDGIAPAYFIPPKANCTETELIKIGNEIIEKFKLFASHIENTEVVDILNSIKNVKIVDTDIRDIDSHNHLLIEEAISDWTYDNTDEEDLIEILSEAYYSIACNYWLSYYFQYPRYADKPEFDFLEPYFNLWKAGYYCRFDSSDLLISNK